MNPIINIQVAGLPCELPGYQNGLATTTAKLTMELGAS